MARSLKADIKKKIPDAISGMCVEARNAPMEGISSLLRFGDLSPLGWHGAVHWAWRAGPSERSASKQLSQAMLPPILSNSVLRHKHPATLALTHCLVLLLPMADCGFLQDCIDIWQGW